MSTHNSQKFIQWSKRIIFTLVFLELAYLLVFNIALNTSYFQKLANKIEPEKFQLQWEYGWSPYPFKIYAKKITFQGKSGSRQWQTDVQSAEASISPFVLMAHKVKVCNINVNDVTYLQKPALSNAAHLSAAQKKDANQTAMTVVSNKKETKAWILTLDGVIKISGHHTFDTNRLAGTFDGDIEAVVALAKKRTPLSIHKGKIHIAGSTLKSKDGKNILKDGEVNGTFEIREKELAATLNLLSKETKLKFNTQHLQSDIDSMITLKILTTPSLHADLSGSTLTLTNTKLSDQNVTQKGESHPWNTKLTIDKGVVMFPLVKNNAMDSFSKIAKKHKVNKLLASAEGKIDVVGDISDLSWVSLMFKNGLNPSVSGSGTINANLLIKKGLLTNQSTAKIKSTNLEVALLDYRFTGEGGLVVEKAKGGENPDLKYTLEFENATMKRKGEKEAMIDNVAMKLDKITNDVNLQGIKTYKALRLQILSAKVKKVSLYNQYFPENSPFKFVDGGADLSADIELKSNDAKGYVKFVTHGLTMMLDEQNISARLSVDTKIVRGEPKKMRFDISGSTIVLDQAKVAAKQTNYSKEDWSANLKLTKADITWKKPVELKSEALLAIKDTRPIIAMINNELSKFSFITQALIMENLRGEASITMANNTITIPSALLKSDRIHIGAKGIIGQGIRDGIFYFQLKGLKALLEIKNSKKRFDIFNAQKGFENYMIPSLTLPGK